MKKSTIFFDLGNVLIFFDHQKMCRQVSEISGLALETVQQLMHTYGDLYERGRINTLKIYEELCKLSKKTLDFSQVVQAISDIFQPNEPAIEILHKVKERGSRLFLLSNTCDAHFSWASSQFPFLKQFDGFVLSYEVDARKPEKKIFEKALERAGCSSDTCFYTDDILPYIEAAREMHIDAEQYTSPQALTLHLQERDLL